MKRLLAALAVVCAVGSFTPAHAAQYDGSPRWVVDDLKIIHTRIPAVRDSGWVCGAAARLDTTAACLITDWNQGIPSVPRAGTAVDSTDWVVFYWIPNPDGAVTISADSIYLQTQVSNDGATWALVTPNISFQVANTVRPYGTGGFVLEASSTNSFVRAYKLAWAVTGQHQTALVGTAPTDNQLWGWKYARFIVGEANGGCYQAAIGHWTAKD